MIRKKQITAGVSAITLITLISGLISGSDIFAQPPNDNCSNATLLCPNAFVSANTTNATAQCARGADGDCGFGTWCFTVTNSVWFKFVTNDVGGSTTITVSSFSGSLDGTLLSSSAECISSGYIVIDCDSNVASSLTLTSNSLQPNTVYWVMIDGADSNQTNFQISVFGAAVQWVAQTTTDATCDNSCDGTATVTPSSGTSPYSYQWDANAGNQTDSTATGLCTGNYLVTVSDSIGCTDTVIISINQLPAATLNIIDEQCATACNGTATATLSSGQTPYIYSWSNSQTTQTVTGLCSGNYSVTVTDSVGCTTIDDFVQFTITELSAIVTTSPERCSGKGSAKAAVEGGTSPYDYLWNNGGTTSSVFGLSSSVYSVTVTDANDCSKTSEGTVAFIECEMKSEMKFSPNGDEINDTWTINNAEFYPNNFVIVYNRWGQRVFSTNGYDNGKNFWDGQYLGVPVPDGAYFYVIYQDKENKKDGEIHGSVVILR